MRVLMTPAVVTPNRDGAPAAVAWNLPSSRLRRQGRRPSRVLSVIDSWRYDGRWWEEEELHRDYFFVELEGGVRVELYREGDGWWVARVSD